jgi:hypothetical protein
MLVYQRVNQMKTSYQYHRLNTLASYVC